MRGGGLMSVLESHVSGIVTEASESAVSIKTNDETVHTFSDLDEVFASLYQVIRAGDVIGLLHTGKFDYKVSKNRIK